MTARQAQKLVDERLELFNGEDLGTLFSNTAAETILARKSIPNNFIGPGSLIHLIARVGIGVLAAQTHTFDLRLRLGSLTGPIIWDMGAFDPADTHTQLIVEADINIRTMAAVDAITKMFATPNNGSITGSQLLATATTPALAGVTGPLLLTGQWSVADAANTFRLHGASSILVYRNRVARILETL